MRRYEYGFCCIDYDLMVSVPEAQILDPATLKSVQNKLIKQATKEKLTLFFRRPQLLVPIATKKKLYTYASVTLKVRLNTLFR